MFVYIGFPIDSSSDSPTNNFRLLVNAVLEVMPESVFYNPFSAFYNVKPSQDHVSSLQKVEKINNYAIHNSNLAVFLWNGTPSFGIPLEIKYCYDNSIPFIVYNSSGKNSVYMLNMTSLFNGPSLALPGVVVNSMEELKNAITKFKMEYKGANKKHEAYKTP